MVRETALPLGRKSTRLPTVRPQGATRPRQGKTPGQPALGDLRNHNPINSPGTRNNLHWGPASVQQVFDVALAWACVNRRFEVASFLLAHGADINSRWSTHEPASILHESPCTGVTTRRGS